MTESGVVAEAGGSPLPPWLRSTAVAWAGALLSCIVIALTAAFLFREKQSLDASEIQSAELYARVLQDHAERTLNTTDIAMAALADSVSSTTRANDSAHLNKELSQAAGGLAFLRSLSVMTADGKVIASSSAGNIGVVVDDRAIPRPLSGATDALGSSVNGRDLDEASAGRTGSAAASRTFVPLVRGMASFSGEQLYLVAVLNPDFFANAYELTLADATRGAGLFSMNGSMLAGTGNIQRLPGQRVENHVFFSRYLPSRESGSIIGPGIDRNQVVTAFRVLRKRPMVIVVERNYARVLSGLRQTALRALGLCLSALLVIAGIMVIAWRNLRAHEAVAATLEATRLHVVARERDLRSLVESVHELIFRADADGKVSFVNRRWSELTGRPIEDVLGKRFSALCQPDERAPCDALFAARRTSETILVHIESGAACMHSFELSVAPVTDPAGTAVGYAGFAVDVTEREAAQQALRSQLKFTERLLEISPTPLFVKDERGSFVTVNRAWLELMDLALPDVLGRNSTDLFGHDALKHEDQDARLLLSEESISYENRLVVAGRSPRDVIVAKVRFTRADGTVAGIVGSIVDVTEFRQAERNIRKARDAAQQANSAKSEFIASISHELRTPLQGILGFSEIGLDLAGDQPGLLDMFTDIHAGGQRMLTLVNGLLDVSQMDSAMGSLALQRTDVAQVVRDAVKQLQPAWSARDLTFTLHGLDVRVDGKLDRDRFQQAARHVLENAVRYSPPGGNVDVCLAHRGKSGIELTVRDRGPGVPEEEVEAIFEAFVQSSRTRDGSGGTGLGLTIARKIMRAHGGSIAAENACGGGTLMRLWIPEAGEETGMNKESAWHDADGLQVTTEPI